MMFPMVLPLPRTSISFGTGAECFLAHTGSASMASGLSVGAFPSKVTVPVMVEAAKATPGQTDTATSPAASHNLFPVPRMLGSLVIANLTPSSSTRRLGSGPTLHRRPPSRACNSAAKASARRVSSAFSNASDSASLGSRSGTSACRRISQPAAATKHPPTATNAATSRTDGRNPSGWSVGMTCQ